MTSPVCIDPTQATTAIDDARLIQLAHSGKNIIDQCELFVYGEETYRLKFSLLRHPVSTSAESVRQEPPLYFEVVDLQALPIKKGGQATIYLSLGVLRLLQGRFAFLGERQHIVKMGASTSFSRVDQLLHQLPTSLHYKPLIVEGDQACLIMDKAEGVTLTQLLKEVNPVLSLREKSQLSIALIDALLEIHEDWGVLHQDIKPDNIIVNKMHKKAATVTFIDYGIACSIAEGTTHPAAFQGTFPYISPEVLRSSPLSKTSDVYSLAMVIALIFGARQKGLSFIAACVKGAQYAKNMCYTNTLPRGTGLSNQTALRLESFLTGMSRYNKQERTSLLDIRTFLVEITIDGDAQEDNVLTRAKPPVVLPKSRYKLENSGWFYPSNLRVTSPLSVFSLNSMSESERCDEPPDFLNGIRSPGVSVGGARLTLMSPQPNDDMELLPPRSVSSHSA